MILEITLSLVARWGGSSWANCPQCRNQDRHTHWDDDRATENEARVGLPLGQGHYWRPDPRSPNYGCDSPGGLNVHHSIINTSLMSPDEWKHLLTGVKCGFSDRWCNGPTSRFRLNLDMSNNYLVTIN